MHEHPSSHNSMQRDIALDCFRGITVLGMVLVNNPGSWSYIYSPLRHPSWDGLSFADLVFPFFILAVGMSIPLAFQKRLDRGETYFQLSKHIFFRSLLLIGAGLLLNGFPDYSWEELRIPGVLQRIGLVYFFCSLGYLFLPRWGLFFLVGGIFLSYTVVTLFLPAWDRPLIEGWKYSPDNHFGAALDRWILGEKHLWKYTKTYDPEGLFSTLPAIGQGFIGVLWSTWIFGKEKNFQLQKYLTPISWILVGIFLVGMVWSIAFPINKTLWTPSYALVTSSIGFGLYLLLRYWLEGKSSDISTTKDTYNPFLLNGIFLPMGRHALFVFLATGILSRIFTMDFQGVVVKRVFWEALTRFISDFYLASFLYALGYCTFTILLLHGYMAIVSLVQVGKSKRFGSA